MQTLRRAVLVILGALAVHACSSSKETTVIDCEPADRRPCVGAGMCVGTEVCQDNKRWSSCTCQPGAGGAAGAAGSGATGGSGATAGAGGSAGTGGSAGSPADAGSDVSTGGAAGASGAAGTGGGAGTGATGATGGSGAAGGAAGSGGTGGSAGTAGSGGTAGAAGSSGAAGSAGSAGSPGDAGLGYPMPLSYWSFDTADTVSTIVLDRGSAGTVNGTLLGGTSSIVGMAGEALNLDGSTGYVNFGNSHNTVFFGSMTATFSISMWIRTTDLSAALFNKNGDSSCAPAENERQFATQIVPSPPATVDGSPAIATSDTNGFNQAQVGPSISVADGNWHHLVLIYTGSSGPLTSRHRVFFDGIMTTTEVIASVGSPSYNLSQNQARLSFGVAVGSANVPCTNGGLGYYAGDVDELALWDIVLDQAQVQAIRARGMTGQRLVP